MVSNSLEGPPLSEQSNWKLKIHTNIVNIDHFSILWVNMMMTFRHTYSSIRSFTRLNMRVTCVIFSTITPTSCRSWSIVMGLPIIEDRQFCSMHRLWDTYVRTMKTVNIHMHINFKQIYFNWQNDWESELTIVKITISSCLVWFYTFK